jgi:hypothetical protein
MLFDFTTQATTEVLSISDSRNAAAAGTGTGTTVKHCQMSDSSVNSHSNNLAWTWSGLAVRAIRCLQTYQSKWTVKLNDQDIFNVILTYHPSLLNILPCRWNVQYHARLNSILACMPGTAAIKYEESYRHRQKEQVEISSTISTATPPLPFFVSDVPSNCDKSIQQNVFMCDSKASILHFMAQSYKAGGSGLGFYNGFWRIYEQLSWNMLKK